MMTCKTNHDGVGGITIGSGVTTGIPVSLNAGHNNILFGGRTGCGKTFAMKIIAKRLAHANPSMAMFVIDPFNNYGDIAKECHLDTVHAGDEGLEFGDHSLILVKDELKYAPTCAKVVRDTLKNVWWRIMKMPKDTAKLVILDEAWLISRDPEGEKIIKTILDFGKKMNVLFLTGVQTVKDAEIGLYKGFDTHVFMKQSDFPTRLQAPTQNEAEIKRIAELHLGCGLLVTADHHVYVRFE